jgi:hypothetical protein
MNGWIVAGILAAALIGLGIAFVVFMWGAAFRG